MNQHVVIAEQAASHAWADLWTVEGQLSGHPSLASALARVSHARRLIEVELFQLRAELDDERRAEAAAPETGRIGAGCPAAPVRHGVGA